MEHDAGNWAVLGGGVIVHGPTCLWLGRLEAARGDWERAVAWSTAAESSALRLDAQLWVLEARADRLSAQHAVGTGDETEVASAISSAHERGLRPIVERLQAITATPLVEGVNVFRRDHDVWTLAFDGVEVRMPDTKGLRDLHTLLANQRTDVPAASLVTAALVNNDVTPVLDTRAKAAYRHRLDELDRELDRAAVRGRRSRRNVRRCSTNCGAPPGSADATGASTTTASGCARPSPHASATPCADSTAATQLSPPTSGRPSTPTPCASTHRPSRSRGCCDPSGGQERDASACRVHPWLGVRRSGEATRRLGAVENDHDAVVVAEPAIGEPSGDHDDVFAVTEDQADAPNMVRKTVDLPEADRSAPDRPRCHPADGTTRRSAAGTPTASPVGMGDLRDAPELPGSVSDRERDLPSLGARFGRVVCRTLAAPCAAAVERSRMRGSGWLLSSAWAGTGRS